MELKLFDRLDQWIRRRIRMCYWKRWRHARTRSRELMRLGVPRRQAIRHAKSRKSYWHMAKTIASGVGFTNAMLAEQGLLSLKTSLERTGSSSSNRLIADPHVGGVGRVTGNGGPYPISSALQSQEQLTSGLTSKW